MLRDQQARGMEILLDVNLPKDLFDGAILKLNIVADLFFLLVLVVLLKILTLQFVL